MPSSDLLARPGRSLRSHIQICSEESAKELRSIRITLDTLGLSPEMLREVSRVLGACHDVGKATSAFQKYIRGETGRSRESNHSLISSVFTYHCVNKLLGEQAPSSLYLPLLCFEVVKRHHGNLKNVRDEALALEDECDHLESQWASIPQDTLFELYSGILPQDYLEHFEVQKTVREIKRASRKIEDLKELGIDYATVALYLYSVLLTADKEDASQLRGERTPELLYPSMLEEYRKARGFGRDTSGVGSLREEVFMESWEAAGKIDLNSRILSLNAPTGSGKTLAALGFALRLRERIRRETGAIPRMVYAISFISVIDQNYSVFEEVYRAAKSADPPSSALLKHHHLADYRYTVEKSNVSTEDDDDPEVYERGEFLVEGWNSELVVTTFVQLFLTFLGGINRSTRKMHTLANSIILLDEVQTISHRHWLLVNRFFEAFSRIFHTYFVFMTATMPMIFSQDEVVEILPDRKGMFGRLDRVELFVHSGELTVEAFVESICQDVEMQPEKRFLVVLNTIKCCQNVYIGVKSRLPGIRVECLSTVLPPKERIRRIESVRAGGDRVIVSTQLVEAGVDLDVDVVYRDFAPLDSLNQVAGRCNRSGQRERGSVHIVTLQDENERLFNKYVYDRFLLGKTLQVLEGRSRLGEADFLDAVEEYYHHVSKGKSDDESRELLRHLSMEEYEGLRSGFQLFEEAGDKIDVFVELDSEATDIWSQYQASRELSPLERKASFLKIKRRFYEFVISVPERFKDVVGYSEETRLGFVSRDEVDKEIMYNVDIGFCVSGESSGGTIII